MKTIKSFLNFSIYSNLFVSVCVLVLALSSEILFGSSNFKVSQFVFFATLFIYNFQRIIRISNGHHHSRKNWTYKNKNLIYLLMTIGSVMSFYRFIDFNLNTQIAIVISGVLSILYPFGIRKVPFSKIFVISLVWTISTMLLLVLENKIEISQNIILHLISRFLFVFAITIPFDIRDIKYDQNNLKTIPIVFGVKKSIIISLVSLLISELIFVYLNIKHLLSLTIFIGIIPTYIFSIYLIINSSNKESDFYFSFWVESLSIIFYLFLSLSILML